MRQKLKRLIQLGAGVALLFLLINAFVLLSTKAKIHKAIDEVPEAYTVIVLGAKVYDNGHVSTYLGNRLNKALELYKKGKVERFLLSGDHGTKGYDEVNTMKTFLMNKGVPQSDIFLDHAGFNTYNTMVRAKKVFEVEDAIIVSQDYHLPRAVYIANRVGINGQGYASSSEHLPGMKRNSIREALARVKSFGEVLFKVSPKFLGEAIPITGDSGKSHD